MRLRALTRAALVAALLVPAVPAHATCVNGRCTAIGPGSVHTESDGAVADSCVYYKQRPPAPADWPPNNDNGGPYVFVRTKAWGDQPATAWGVGWDYRVCDLLLAAKDVIGRG